MSKSESLGVWKEYGKATHITFLFFFRWSKTVMFVLCLQYVGGTALTLSICVYICLALNHSKYNPFLICFIGICFNKGEYL